MNKKRLVLFCLPLCMLAGCKSQVEPVKQQLQDPKFENVSVHDPSIIQSDDEFYIVGSHAMLAKSADLIKWQQLANSVSTDMLFEDIREELKEEFAYAKTNTLWASDLVQFKNGKYYLYYCLCVGDSPLSVLGVAVADSVDGPFKKVESFLYSGTSPQFGKIYDATKHPNVIDPHVFYDNDEKLWMVYGSYSGGIFILELDEATGLPKEGQGYGKHLLGGNHSRIEAPYIQYNKDTGYYYLFTSFGGLTADGGYQIRVARSKAPDGPYEDMEGNPMASVKGAVGTVFDDFSIQDYGVKLIGNFSYEPDDGLTNAGYISPGHNSTYYDEETDNYYVIFHTRFLNAGEMHEVRVHQMYFTEDGWPVLAPLRYSGEAIDRYQINQVATSYRLLAFDKEITADFIEPQFVQLGRNGKLTGDLSGDWQISSDNITEDSSIKIEGVTYRGKFVSNWDEQQEKQVMTFTGISDKGIPLFMIEEKEK
ncbi:glycoside hydrolase family 43 protein [Streptococcus ovuberis]|uniref:glycoside hydrolase family 43 protein n=1 Tax=Streptococcus ovuberis TaxID=1936207 RepID=UPI001FEAE9C2|nr:glycoside hydrolase family 43 protein [Streptococcus ovuberis]